MNDKKSFTHKARNLALTTRNKAAAVGTGLALMAGGAMAQVDTAGVVTEIGAAKTAGYAVLGAMILAALGFKAWKLLFRA